ncbi:MAG: AAA family ATPase, partial [Acidimicrobiales bacterium]
MRITRLLVRNYRVFADELELEVPPGLVGVYGVNGAGKSSLVGAIPWALFGFSRTGNEDVRTSGVGAESLVEVELEHEGHLYSVRRTISGVNSTVRARASVDGTQVADGVRDTVRYVRSVLGLDDVAFRASVFAEQKQLAAFSGTTPAKRRDLVLKLLGITPLDAARDRSRADARAARADLERLRGMLPDLEVLNSTAEETALASRAAKNAADGAGAELAERRRQLGAARRVHDERSVTAAEHAAVVNEGQQVRRQHEAALARVAELEAELSGLAGARARLADLEVAAAELPAAQARLAAVEALRRAEAALAAAPAADVEVPPPDDVACAQARQAAEEARAALATSDALMAEAVGQRDRAAAALEQSGRLSGQGCPLCGQELGEAFAQVQAHRTAELAAAESRVRLLSDNRPALARSVDAAVTRARQAAEALEHARQARSAWERAQSARASADDAVAMAAATLDPPLRPEDDELATSVDRLRQALAES